MADKDGEFPADEEPQWSVGADARNRDEGQGGDTAHNGRVDEEGADAAQRRDGDGRNVAAEPAELPGKPRQWLIDRMFGKSPPPESKPPCWLCYVPPLISLAPDLLEQNCFCERIGKTGVIDPDESAWRKPLMRSALFFNSVAAVLAVTSCFAISTKFGILRNVQFSRGRVFVTNLTSGDTLDRLTGDVSIGLRAVAYSDDFGQEVISFAEFCDYNGTGLETFILPENCQSCAEASDSLILTLAMSAFPYIPSIITNVLRSYPNYDINCMKTFSTLAAGTSMALSMYSFLAYRFMCFFSFYKGDVFFADNSTEVPSDSGEAVGKVTVSWSPGSGLICIIFATALIGVDVILNMMVPTPSITRDHEKQAEYERQPTSGATMNMSPGAFIGTFLDMLRGRNKSE